MKPRRSKQIKQKNTKNTLQQPPGECPLLGFSRLRQPVVASACCVNRLAAEGIGQLFEITALGIA